MRVTTSYVYDILNRRTYSYTKTKQNAYLLTNIKSSANIRAGREGGGHHPPLFHFLSRARTSATTTVTNEANPGPSQCAVQQSTCNTSPFSRIIYTCACYPHISSPPNTYTARPTSPRSFVNPIYDDFNCKPQSVLCQKKETFYRIYYEQINSRIIVLRLTFRVFPVNF